MISSNFSFFSAALFLLFIFQLSSCRVSEEGYGRWDADRNTMIDNNEFSTVWTETRYFSRWDATRDNFIEENEWRAGRNAYMQNYDENQYGTFSDWDADGDGRLNEEEFRDRIFEVYDLDRDGTLSEEEYGMWWSSFNRGPQTN